MRFSYHRVILWLTFYCLTWILSAYQVNFRKLSDTSLNQKVSRQLQFQANQLSCKFNIRFNFLLIFSPISAGFLWLDPVLSHNLRCFVAFQGYVSFIENLFWIATLRFFPVVFTEAPLCWGKLRGKQAAEMVWLLSHPEIFHCNFCS